MCVGLLFRKYLVKWSNLPQLKYRTINFYRIYDIRAELDTLFDACAVYSSLISLNDAQVKLSSLLLLLMNIVLIWHQVALSVLIVLTDETIGAYSKHFEINNINIFMYVTFSTMKLIEAREYKRDSNFTMFPIRILCVL